MTGLLKVPDGVGVVEVAEVVDIVELEFMVGVKELAEFGHVESHILLVLLTLVIIACLSVNNGQRHK